MDKVIAYWIGVHAIEFLLILSLVTLGIIFLLWRGIENYHQALWQLGNWVWRYFKSLEHVQRFYGQYPKVWRFVQGRLSPLGYLEIYLAVGLIIMVIIAFNIFGGIAEQVTEEGGIVEFDQTLATSIYQNTTPAEISFFKFITALGGRAATIIIGLGMSLVLVIRRKKILLFSWAAAILGNSLLNAVLKATFERGRPEFPDPVLVETNWSFPSGHAMGAMVLYGMLTYLITLRFKRTASKAIIMSMIILVLFIGFSRLYLGAHYFSDVMAGYVVGMAWLATVISGTEIARRHGGWGRSSDTSLETKGINRLAGAERLNKG